MAELFEANLPRLTHVALRVLRNREDSEDAVQEGLLSAFTHLDQFRGQAKFSTWLHSIVVNASLVSLRKQKSHPAMPLDDLSAGENEVSFVKYIADPAPAIDQCLARKEQVQILRQTIALLPADFQSAIRICGIEGVPTKEAAQRLGISIPALKTRLFRARYLISDRLRRAERVRAHDRKLSESRLARRVPSPVENREPACAEFIPSQCAAD